MPVKGIPKSFIEALFTSACLRAALRRMIHLRAIPDGLKPQECKRNVGQSKPPIPYIPEEDVIQATLDGSANALKLILSHKMEVHAPVWSKTHEQFLVHVQQALDASRQKGLITTFENDKANEALANYAREDLNPPKANAAQKATKTSTCATEAVAPIINQLFQLYSNLLVEEAQQPWNKVIGEKIDCEC